MAVEELGEGGESKIYKLESFKPVEAVAKVSKQEVISLMRENIMLRESAHEDYVCSLFEEIIVYDTQALKPVSVVAIVEQAVLDLSKLVEIWKNKDQSEQRLEQYGEEKLIYIGLRAMQGMDFLHSKNISNGDMKP